MSFLTNLRSVRRIASVFYSSLWFFSLSGPSCLWEDSWTQLHVFPPTAKAAWLTPVSYSRAPYVPSGWQHAPYSLRCLGTHLFIEEACLSIPFGERQLHWDSPKGGSILGQVGLGCMLYQPYRKGTNPPCDTGEVVILWLPPDCSTLKQISFPCISYHPLHGPCKCISLAYLCFCQSWFGYQ